MKPQQIKNKTWWHFVLVPNSFVSREKPDLNTISMHLFNSLWIKFREKDQSIHFVVNFNNRPARNLIEKHLEELERSINLAILENIHLVVMGERNIDYLTVTEKECLDTVNVSYDLSFCISSVLTILIAQTSSFFYYKITGSAIKTREDRTFISDKLFKSDHEAAHSIFISTLPNTPTLANQSKKIFCHKNYNMEKINSLVENSDCTDFYQQKCAKGFFSTFTNTSGKTLETCVLKNTNFIRNNKNRTIFWKIWISKTTKHQKKCC